ncbi:MAG: hypothetical protein HN341_03835, partial [Verrucomicrobia bacterium]|nr:hypothetical protein [Verrucomicrobiota bacterium]
NFVDDDATTEQLSSISGVFNAGTCVENPSNATDPIDIGAAAHTDIEYCLIPTENAVGGKTYYFRLSDSGTQFYEHYNYAALSVVTQPTVVNQSATDIDVNSATLRGEVTDTGGDEPDVTICWGEAVDTLTNEIDLGGRSGEFSSSISSLTANKTYYYQCTASNAAGKVLATPVTNFTAAAPTLTFSASTPSVGEGDGSISIGVSLSAASATGITVDYETADDSAVQPGDYTTTDDSLSWSVGESGTKSFSVTINSDGTDESDELFNVILSNPVNAEFAVGTRLTNSVEIVDDDGEPTVAFALSASSGSETTAEPSIVLSLSEASGVDITVNYSVTGGDAAGGGVDYTLANGMATITSGNTVTNIPLQVTDDSDHEEDETVVISISDPTNADLGQKTTHTYTIQSDDVGLATINNGNGATEISANSAKVRATIVSTGGEDVDVSIYLGTSDKGKTTVGWDKSGSLNNEGVGDIDLTFGGLTEGSNYYYRCLAVNSAGSVWSPNAESFVAEDPPSVDLLSNGGMELQGSSGSDAKHWTRGDESDIARVNDIPRTGSYSVRFTGSSGNTLYGSTSNAFRLSWSGIQQDNDVHTIGGLRPGFIVEGNAWTRSKDGLDDVQFTYRLRNVTDASDWMSDSHTHDSIPPTEVAISNDNPLPPGTCGDILRPEVIRDDGGADYANIDDVTMTAYTPKLVLDPVPGSVAFSDTLDGTSSDLEFDVRSQGGTSDTVLYGAYVTNSVALTNGSRDATAWVVIGDDEFEIVSGANVVATEGAGDQTMTLRFTPTSAGDYSAILRVATTDPVDRYSGGGTLFDGIVYEEFEVSATALAKPTISIGSISVDETDSNFDATFTVSLDASTIEDVTVQYATANGTATAGSDYLATNDTVTITAGNTSTTLTVTIVGEEVQDSALTEIFYVDLSDAVNATIGDAQASCTITDDESQPAPTLFRFK